jgi:hypothetical protein
MKRICSCGALSVYDDTGRLRQESSGPACLTDNEVRGMLTVLLHEWRRRCGDAEQAALH